MIQLELYLKEISNFLRTLTFKNTFLADHMFNTWVSDDYKSVVYNSATNTYDYSLHPYYRNLMGNYILFDYTPLEQAYGIYKERLTAAEYKAKFDTIIAPLIEEYNLKLTSTVKGRTPGEPSIEVPNTKLYTKCNVLPIVSSFDTKTKIPFTKELLKGKHSNTAEIYKIPNQRYYKLLEKYPTSSDIIKSIVYPVTLTEAEEKQGITVLDKIVNAEDFSILSYDDSSLEQQERQSMYDCVQVTLDMIRRRYAIKEYCFENMYPQAHQYLIWQILWLALFVQRISNIRSGNVHTYHIWSYLKSHGLGEYRDVLTIRQQQFLYRNLRYLIEHKGTQHALEILIYVLLSSQNISLQGKNTKQMTRDVHGLNSLSDTAKKSSAIQSVSIAKPMRDAISGMYRVDPHTRFQDIIEYMGLHAGENSQNDQQEYTDGYTEESSIVYKKEREAGLEYKNDYLYGKSTQRCTDLFNASSVSHRNTKLLELTNGASSDLYAQIYTKFVAESIIYRIYMGDMNFSITFNVPGSPLQVVLPAKDAVGIIFYILNKINKIELYETVDGIKRNTTYSVNGLFQGFNPDDKMSVTGSPTPEFDMSQKTELWKYGTRVYKDLVLMDKPPTKFMVEWPYKTMFNGMVQDFPAMPDYFKWNSAIIRTPGYLRNIVLTYFATIRGEQVQFDIADASAPEASRSWESADGLVISYYSSRSFWTITDKNGNILYRTEQLENFKSTVESMQWYTASGEPVSIGMVIGDRRYVLDMNMKNYHGQFTKASDFATKVHNQAIDFLQLFIEDSSNGEAIFHSLYEKIKSERCVSAVLPITLLNGKTYEKYLAADDDYIKVLRQTFNDYDHEQDASLLYNKLLNTILEALFPVEDTLLSSGVALVGEKYSKLIKLFKSMIPYNLAFISSAYNDVNSTIFRPVKTSVKSEFFLKGVNEVDVYREDCRTKYFSIYPTTHIDSQQCLVWHSVVDDDTLDTKYKVTILNMCNDIVKILDSNKAMSTKKSRLKKLLSAEDYTTAELNDLIAWLLNHRQQTSNIRMANKLAKREIINDDIHEEFDNYIFVPTRDAHIVKGTEYYQEDVYQLTSDRVAKEGTVYFTRTGKGTLAVPFQYDVAFVTPGDPIPEYTYFVKRERSLMRKVQALPGETITPEYQLYVKHHPAQFKQSILVIGKDATDAQIQEFSDLIN